MKLRYGSIILVLVILAAVLVAGCTFSKTIELGSNATATPAATNVVSKAPTATASSGGVMLSTIYKMGSFKWYEYLMTSKFGDMNVKYEYDTASYGGVSNARYLKYTMIMGKGTAQEMTMLYDLYYDGSKFLGGHTKVSSGGSVMSDQDIAADDSTYANLDTTYSTVNRGSTVPIVPAGADTVTVPAGTYACTKYTADAGGYKGTYWVAPNVPVPVKMETLDSSGELTGTMELVGWG
jgi:hypothetical protein